MRTTARGRQIPLAADKIEEFAIVDTTTVISVPWCGFVPVLQRLRYRQFGMTHPGALSDVELMARAHRWRHAAMRGDVSARALAQLHEIEVWRRFDSAQVKHSENDAARSPWWKFW